MTDVKNSFAVRNGLIQNKKEEVSDGLRNALVEYINASNRKDFKIILELSNLFGFSGSAKAKKEQLFVYIKNCKWYEFYDLIEILVDHLFDYANLHCQINHDYFSMVQEGQKYWALYHNEVAELNRMLRIHHSIYSIDSSSKMLCYSLSETESELYGIAINTKVKETNKCIILAYEALSARNCEDYRDVITHCSNAIEAFLNFYKRDENDQQDKDTSLNKAIKNFKNIMDADIYSTISSWYQYACNHGRHGKSDEFSVNFSEAKLSFVIILSCLNYLSEIIEKKGINND